MNLIAIPKHGLLIALTADMITVTGCGNDGLTHPGDVQTTGQELELGNAAAVRATIRAMTSGDVAIHDGADHLLSAQFTYNKLLKPDVSYIVDGTLGTLDISQPEQQNLTSRELDNEWDLRFGTSAPLDLSTHVTSGDTKIDISTSQLTSLNCNTVSGNTSASIGGNQAHLHRIDMKSTSGTVHLDVNGTFPSLDSLALSNSSGNMDVSISGDFQSLSNLQIKNISGNVNLNLGGSFSHNIESSIQTSSGNAHVHLPANVGVQVTASVSSGTITANGLHLEGGSYVNDVFGTSAVTLLIDVHVTSGNVELSVGG